MLPKEKPKSIIAINKPPFDKSSWMKVMKKDVREAKAIAATATGDLFPYATSVSGPKVHVPIKVATS